MDYKKILKTSIQFITHPATAWWVVQHKGAKNNILNEFLYPFIILCGASLFIGRILNNGSSWVSFYTSVIIATLHAFSLLLAYHISVHLITRFSNRYTKKEYPHNTTDTFIGYSMVVILGLDVCLGLFPDIRILAFIAQFYTLKIVWDGAAVLMKIQEERRLTYTMFVSATIIIIPVVIDKLIGILSVLLR